MPRVLNRVLARLRVTAFLVAAEKGHLLAPFEPDATFGAEIAVCRNCERVVSIDANPEGGIFGRGTYIECDHIPVVGYSEYCPCLGCAVQRKALERIARSA